MNTVDPDVWKPQYMPAAAQVSDADRQIHNFARRASDVTYDLRNAWVSLGRLVSFLTHSEVIQNDLASRNVDRAQVLAIVTSKRDEIAVIKATLEMSLFGSKTDVGT